MSPKIKRLTVFGTFALFDLCTVDSLVLNKVSLKTITCLRWMRDTKNPLLVLRTVCVRSLEEKHYYALPNTILLR